MLSDRSLSGWKRWSGSFLSPSKQDEITTSLGLPLLRNLSFRCPFIDSRTSDRQNLHACVLSLLPSAIESSFPLFHYLAQHICREQEHIQVPYSVESDLVALTAEAKERSKIRPKSRKFSRRNKRRPVARPSTRKKCFSWRSEEAQLRASP